MTAEHDQAMPEVEQDSGVEEAPEAPAPGASAGEPESPEVPARGPEAREVRAGEPEAPTAPTADENPTASPDESPDDHERRLEQDLQELTARAEKADEYLELAKRTKADFENYRKRASREAAAAQERGVVRLAKELLPAVDNLDRALAAADQNGDGTLADGIKLVHADVIAALARFGIEPFFPEGEPFDPQRHEAVAQLPVEGAAPGTIIEVYQRGYRLGESVLRPARVVVAG